MADINKISLMHFAATVADLMGVERPEHAAEPIQWAVDTLRDLGREPFDRLFIYNPDCCAEWMFEKYPQYLEMVQKHTQLTIPFCTMMPSFTPVCFGTMYTGAEPAVHGITKYEQKLITIDSLFDRYIAAGKRICIISKSGCSMSKIWNGKDMDYYIYDSEGEIIEKARNVILKDDYDAVVVYTHGYDKCDHKYGPEDPHSMAAFYEQAAQFEFMMRVLKDNWKDHTTLVGFCPDHGCHKCVPGPENDFHEGTHGSDSPFDMNILHFLGAVKKAVK